MKSRHVVLWSNTAISHQNALPHFRYHEEGCTKEQMIMSKVHFLLLSHCSSLVT